MTADVPVVPSEIISRWKRVVGLLAQLAQVRAALFLPTELSRYSVRVDSRNSSVWRERVLEESPFRHYVLETDAACDPDCAGDPALDPDASPCVRVPLRWPRGGLFGTICYVDQHPNERALVFREALQALADMIEASLRSLVESAERNRREAVLQQSLDQSEKRVDGKTRSLKEASTAIRVLLENLEDSRLEHSEVILRQVDLLVIPYISKLRNFVRDDGPGGEYLRLAEDNLNALTSPLSTKLAETFADLTATEVEIAQLVMHGKRTKEIAGILSRAPGTINFHRNNIRKKVRLGRGENLRAYLLSIL